MHIFLKILVSAQHPAVKSHSLYTDPHMVPPELHTQIAMIIGRHLEQQGLVCLQIHKKVFCYDKVKHIYFDTIVYIYKHSNRQAHTKQVV